MALLTSKKPTLSRTNTGLVSGSGINLLGNMPAGNYNIITNPVKTRSGKIIDAADTQTISYSSSMKQAAEQLAKSGNLIEKAAANYYLFMDDPKKKGSAKYYENILKKAGIDINAKSNTGNPVGDFAFDVVKGFVGAPAQTGRALAGGGLGAVLLSKEQNKGETLKGGAKNLVDSTVQTAVESPGQLVGGALAGAVGAKGLGILSKKPTVPNTIKTSDIKQTGVKSGSQTLDADFTIKGTSYKYKNKADGQATIQKSKKTNTAKTEGARNTATLNKFLKQDRASAIGKKIELENRAGKEPVITSGRKQQNALITAKEARTPRNNTHKERRRVEQVVEIQKRSGAIFQDMRNQNIPQRISQEWGLVTAEEARKPRNKSIQEKRRVQKVKEAQRKSGAAKPAPATLLEKQRTGTKRKGSGKQTATKKTAKRKPRAYETKVTRITSVEGASGISRKQSVPRYAAGASRPITIQEGGKIRFTRSGTVTDPTYTLKLEPASASRQPRMQKALDKAKTKTATKPAARNPAKTKAKARSESPRKKTSVEFEKIDTEQFVRSSASSRKTGTAAPKKRTTGSRPKKQTETVKEVDNGNGTKAFVRVKTTKADSKPASAKVRAQGQRPKGKVRQKTKTKTKTAAAGKQTRVTGDKRTITVTAKPVRQTTKTQRIVKPTSEQKFRSGTAGVTVTTAKTGKTKTTVVPENVTVTGTVTAGTTGSVTAGTAKKEGDSKTRKLTIPKTASKGRAQTVKKTKAATSTPKTKTKKTTRLRLKEEEKKKKKRIVKVKDDSALRMETVNQFGWLGIDKKPAAKPRRVK